MAQPGEPSSPVAPNGNGAAGPPRTHDSSAMSAGETRACEVLPRRDETRDDEILVEHQEKPKARSEEGSFKSFRATIFAKKLEFSWWFPKINDAEEQDGEITNDSLLRVLKSRRSRALLLQIFLVVVILATNLVLTVTAITKFTSEDGVGVIYDGDCTTVANLDQWLHLLINLLSTGLLSASNYCMQLQAAPTRANVDRAHREGRWLDIGVPSLRNFASIGGWKKVSWLLLACSSVPIHLIYNSAVFQSLSSYDYTVAVVKDSFLLGAEWSMASAELHRGVDPGWNESRVNPPSINTTQVIQQMQRDVLKVPYQNLSVNNCFERYADYFQPQGNVVILVKNESVQAPANDSLLMCVTINPRSDDWAKNMWAASNGTQHFTLSEPTGDVTTWFLGPPRYEVRSCLAEQPASYSKICRFEYCPWIMIAVCALNFFKAITMVIIWGLRRWQEKERHESQRQVLYTLGDAISSFMRTPDPTTRDMGLATRDHFLRKRTLRSKLVKQGPRPPQGPLEFHTKPSRWYKAASWRRWMFLVVLCLLILMVSTILFAMCYPSLKRRNIGTSLDSFWSMGFGQLQPYTYLVIGLPRRDPEGLIANVLVANLPQFLLSVLYIFYNSMLSTFLVQREFSLMYKKRKTLRVSEPVGIQRSSYFISLPLRYGIPLYLTSGIMHWLISQSLFLARITALSPEGEYDVANSFSTCGYSPIAIFITLLVSLVLLLAVVAIGFFGVYDGTMPMVSTNSRAISAACHVMQEDRNHGYLMPVQWGVVEIKDGVGKVAFTTAPSHVIQQPKEGRFYT